MGLFYIVHKIDLPSLALVFSAQYDLQPFCSPNTLSQSVLDFPVKIARNFTMTVAKMGYKSPHYVMANSAVKS